MNQIGWKHSIRLSNYVRAHTITYQQGTIGVRQTDLLREWPLTFEIKCGKFNWKYRAVYYVQDVELHEVFLSLLGSRLGRQPGARVLSILYVMREITEPTRRRTFRLPF